MPLMWMLLAVLVGCGRTDPRPMGGPETAEVYAVEVQQGDANILQVRQHGGVGLRVAVQDGRACILIVSQRQGVPERCVPLDEATELLSRPQVRR